MSIDFDLNFESSDTNFELITEEVTLVPTGTDDHRALTHRNDDNQHSISSITGLQAELSSNDSSLSRLDDVKLEESDLNEFSNLEIQALWNQLIS